ncbi:unnamed protein product [Sphagnum balticum]
MDDDVEAGGGRELDVTSGDVNGVSTMGRTSRGDLESGGGVNNSIVEADQVNDVEREIRNLLAFTDEDVNHKTLCKVALKEWQNNADLFGNRVDKRKKEYRHIRNEVNQLIAFFSAFQGLLLTAVGLMQFKKPVLVLALSAFATVLTVIGVGQKNMQIRELRKTIEDEDPTHKVHFSLYQNNRLSGVFKMCDKC